VRAAGAAGGAVVAVELGGVAAQAVSEGLVGSVSASTVRRWLFEDTIKPWQYRSWMCGVRRPSSCSGGGGKSSVSSETGSRRSHGPFVGSSATTLDERDKNMSMLHCPMGADHGGAGTG
jgi:hypothetical protein